MGLWLVAADRDLFTLLFGFGRLWNGDRQYAFFEACLGFVFDQALGQRDGTVEVTHRSFHQVIVVVLFVAFRFSFTANGQDVVGQFDLNIFFVHSRNIGSDAHFLVVFRQVHIDVPCFVTLAQVTASWPG